jgi:DNA-binding response OmpR family regulator
VFATAGPALAAATAVGSAVAQVTSRADAFEDALARHRHRLVIASAPPAGPAELAMLAEARRRRPSLRIVLVDAPGAAEERLAALRAGFDEALPSSIAAAELLGRIRLLLGRGITGRRAPRPRRRVVARGVEVDLVAHEVRRDGRPLHVRPKEFALLAQLAAHPGRAYSREELLRLVWGEGRLGDRRTVDVHVRWLRSKIEHDPSHPAHLVTVRGVGYRLDPEPLTEP